MDENVSLDAPAQAGRRVALLKFLAGFVGWFLVTLPAVRFTDFFFGAYVPLNLSVAAALLLFKRTRLVGSGMAAAMAVNFLVSSILGTVMSPRDLAPVILPSVYQNRWNFNRHYVSKDLAPGAFSECASSSTVVSDRIAFESWHLGYPEIHLMNADGSGDVNLSSRPGEDAHPAWSPDGRQIAFTAFQGANVDIFVMAADGSGRKRLTEDPGMDMTPAWSPDGRQIAFFSNRDGNVEIYTMNADGSDQTNLTHDPGEDYEPAWSPDGGQIAFNSNRDEQDVEFPADTGVYVMNADGTGVKRLTGLSMTGLRPAWSPNGKCIVYQSGVSFQDWIMLVKMDGSEPVRLVHGGISPQWSPDGRQLVYSVVHGEWNQEIYTLDLDTLKTERLTNNRDNDTNPTWKP